MKTIALDFDGVIHRYSKKWHDGTCYDVPMEGTSEALKELMKYHTVFIFSTRSPEQISDWMSVNLPEFKTEIITTLGFWQKEGILGITNLKLPAMIYVDDRGLRFTNWKDTLNYVR